MSEQRGWGDVFRDNLDRAIGLYIEDQFDEGASEQEEGPAELANPQTVTQPVYQSQLPSGQPLNGTAQGSMPANPWVLVGGGLGLVITTALLVKLLR